MDSQGHFVPSNPLLSFSNFIHQHCIRLGAELASRLEETKRLAGTIASSNWLSLGNSSHLLAISPPFASLAQQKQDLAATLSADFVAKSLAGTSVYTVSNSNNEFVLISDPNGAKSIGLLCFRQEDAEAFLAQVRLRKRELRSGTRVVPINLDQVYMLKVEGIAFRFLPDPVQIRNALEEGGALHSKLVIEDAEIESSSPLTSCPFCKLSRGFICAQASYAEPDDYQDQLKAADIKSGFDGVPVFQSELLVVKKKNRRYCPVYFSKEDIVQELSKVSRASRGPGIYQHIVVGSLEDVLKKMEMSEKNSGWDDLIFIPPGKSQSQHIQEINKAR